MVRWWWRTQVALAMKKALATVVSKETGCSAVEWGMVRRPVAAAAAVGRRVADVEAMQDAAGGLSYWRNRTNRIEDDG